MKKNVIALLLSVVLAMGSAGTAAPAFAAEMTVRDAEGAEGQDTGEQNNEAQESEEQDPAGQEAVTEEGSEAEQEETAEGTEEPGTGLTDGDHPENETAQTEEETEQDTEGSAEEQGEPSDPSEAAQAAAEEEAADFTDPGDTAEEAADAPEEAADAPEEAADAAEEADDAPEEADDAPEEAVDAEVPSEIEEAIVTAEENEAVQAENVIDSGTCGTTALWTLTGTSNNMTLTISGSGAMTKYSARYEVDIEGYIPNTPWYSKNTKIREIIIQEGITSIGAYAFLSCSNVTSATIPSSVTSIAEYAFYGCSSLTSIKLPSKLTSMGNYAFRGCSSLTSVVIPSGMKAISDSAFSSCGLKNVALGSSVRSIGKYAFSYNNLTSLVIPASVESIGEYAFSGNKPLTDITIQIGVRKIWDNAFSGCYLESVTIPGTVTSIGSKAFYNCSRLKNIKIPNTVNSIGGYAFSGCKSLTRIDIPRSVNSIGESAFSGSGLESIHFADLETLLKTNRNADCGPLDFYIGDELFTDLAIPDGVMGVVVKNCKSLKRVTAPYKVNGSYWIRFDGCCDLESVTIPDGVKSINENAFSGCKSLTNVVIPDSVIDIQSRAFANCKSLTDIELPDSVVDIGEHAFTGSGLTRLSLPKNITFICNYALDGCDSLKEVSIPGKVTNIEQYAFGHESDYYRETGETYIFPKDIECLILYHGTKAQWEAAVGTMVSHYKSVIFDPSEVDVQFQLEKDVYNCSSKPIEPQVKVVYNGRQLVRGTDYDLTYDRNSYIGTATVMVNLTGKYSGTVTLHFKIRLGNTSKVTCTNVASGMKVSWVKVSGATRYDVYRGDKKLFTTSALAVTDKQVKYSSGKKYTYKVIAYARSCGYSDSFKTGTYYRLMPVGIKSLTNPSAGKMTVTYDKSSGSSGYVVRYGLKSDMSDAKVITVQGQNTLSRTFGGMKKGKTYYVQVRTYKLDNGVRYYSGYCTTKKITIKK